ncbi:BID domain-containing T4SS effector [Bartonella raoultii]|uniref:BID domain-containing T4SS effector n=1 Tax=Bartonella raoultii TaxID=1457020 RepID=A0ABS7I3J2_9HYPH|nr:BID domain-containing T4SS effector [Bartonella raoultii]MBX4335236.1 BID domain-containing T4SS effector [Bartonella raoultii]
MKKSQSSPQHASKAFSPQVPKSQNQAPKSQTVEDPIYENLKLGRESAVFTKSLKEDVIYTEVQIQKPYPPFHKSPQEQVIYAEIKKSNRKTSKIRQEMRYAIEEASQSAITPATEEEKLKKVRTAPLVKAYVKNAHRWAETVYGHKNALQEQIDAIVQKPSLGEEISWKIIEHPMSFGNLAGRNLWGLKDSSRKQAEEGIRFLSSAINGLTEAVKYTQEERSLTSQKRQMRHGISQETAVNLQKQQSVSTPERRVSSLSQEAISSMLRDNTSVQRYEARIEHWCSIVFGHKHVLQKKIKEIQQNPGMAEEIAWQVGASPKSVGNLRGRNLCGLKNNARIYAENGISHLCDAIENYGEAIKLITESFKQSHKEQRKHQESASHVHQDFHKQKAVLKPSQEVSRSSQEQEPKVVQPHLKAVGSSKHQKSSILSSKGENEQNLNTQSSKHQLPALPAKKVGGAKSVACAL